MSWLDEKCEKFRKLPLWLFSMHIFAKFLFGVGLGLLLAYYFAPDCACVGWLVVLASIILSIPGIVAISKK